MSEKNVAESSKPKPLRLAMPSTGLAKWTTLAKVLKLLVSKIGFRLEIDGAESAEQTGDGLRFKLSPGEAGGDHPFKGVPFGSELMCLGGWANDIEMPDYIVDFDLLPAGLVLVKLEFDMQIEDGYLFNAPLMTAEISIYGEMPDDDIVNGVFYLRLFSYDGQNVVQNARRDLRVKVCADNGNSALAELYVLQI